MSKPEDLRQPVSEHPALAPQHTRIREMGNSLTPIRRLLIANRGEIACRVIHSAKLMGITTIAVYSDADRHAKHVRMADEALYIGPSPALDSYLAIDKLIKAASVSQADAVHPGYGFLSENVAFARACHQHGIIFVGPGPDAMAAMSSKSDAKTIMESAGVPLLPGYHGDDDSLENLTAEATRIGFPVILKPALGGGGKGMKIVRQQSDLAEAVLSAKREAKSAFGDDRLLLEKYLTEPRHIEVQIFADQHGHCVYLSDRDCSVQRRHQKIIEEAPAPGLSDSLRQQMGEAAVQAAQAIDYVGAGTVEFLYDARQDSYFFMEMNTRLQVEHPVTEMITGQDLVQWQLRVAEGRPLPLTQSEIRHQGHAVEARLYAEDTQHGFLPASGLIHFLSEPDSGAFSAGKAQAVGSRIDSGITQGDTVTTYYDPMLAKVIAWGDNRASAIHQLQCALSQYQVGGVATNLQYLQRILAHPSFTRGELTTHFIERYQDSLQPAAPSVIGVQTPDGADYQLSRNLVLSAASLCLLQNETDQTSGWRLNQAAQHLITLYDAELTANTFRFTADKDDRNQLLLTRYSADPSRHAGNKALVLSPLSLRLLATKTDQHVTDITLEVEGKHEHIRLVFDHAAQSVLAFTEQEQYVYQLRPSFGPHESAVKDSPTAPLNGIVVEILCQQGDRVEKDQGLVVIEAMKMEYTVRAPHQGQVLSVLAGAGDQVQHGQELVQLSPATDSADSKQSV
ncbi:biotin carboxylase N-terminal domain-containing protein [Photobacterium salinisoli]|uniref:ATP-binding protein n=1 Tax=Photobacterium salinisoli TaxID=1616783 RepID=UPI0023E21A34|nr:biotin carboxylase N-terminal domain-containing protein [Photobacterium salinisoli]